MKYIVYVTEGQYSDFGVCGIMVGDVEPMRILNELTDKMSDGRWKEFGRMTVTSYIDHAQSKMEQALMTTIRKKAMATLAENGFVEHEATEAWLG